ncbi:MAG: glycogen/starch/alpha-glucan phosphorylase, partial [Oscillospiraceae bacterium]|nr:glycogen/starch/alpha-glucan phosphorylase [Oscillospiraceae bacterium]
MENTVSREQFEEWLSTELASAGRTTKNATDEEFYHATATIMRRIMKEKRAHFRADYQARGRKQVYYLCMEFLLGRSLKNSIYNLKMQDIVGDVLGKFNVKMENLFELEPDAGLGNGGLGRLAACFMDALATQEYPAMGYSILYEYGIFKQKIIDGWQSEQPDNWLPGGKVWLEEIPDHAVDIHFGGTIEEYWDYGYHHVQHKDYTTVKAVPFDIMISGYDTKGVSVLRLWTAKSPVFDMESFNRGDYASALGGNTNAEVISKILYPNDNHPQGKALRLKQ